MKRRAFFPIIAGAMFLSACVSKLKHYNGPKVTKIIVKKSSRKMLLIHETKVLKIYEVELGFQPRGHKEIEGDGRTPEGRYYIDRRNPSSTFHLSLGLSYPNAADRAKAKKLGQDPGGDIFIHGGPVLWWERSKPDWTAGCISISNTHMETVYSMVALGTPIDVLP